MVGSCGQRSRLSNFRLGRLAPYGGAVTDSFSGELWNGISDIYGAILVHPFISGLTDGTLPAESFAFFIVQDGLYLRQFASALATIASQAPRPAATRMFAQHSAN